MSNEVDEQRQRFGLDSDALAVEHETADPRVQLEACERPPRDTRSPRGWLATVTRQAVRKIRRGENRRDEREVAVARPERVPAAAEIAEREETRRKLLDAVLALDETYRSAIVLRYLETRIYNALLESLTSESASRRFAMKNATDAADDMQKALKSVYNRKRQENITKELLDIVGGTEALR